jgi:hypothetical protein
MHVDDVKIGSNKTTDKGNDMEGKPKSGCTGEEDSHRDSSLNICVCLVANVIILQTVVVQLNSQAVLRGRYV